jgi:hypothetical protein
VTGTPLTDLHVLDEPRLYGLIGTLSGFAYYVDTRHRMPRMLRTTFGADAGWDPDDDIWRALILLESMPRRHAADGRRMYPKEVDWTDRRPWVLRTSRRHVLTWYSPQQPYDVETLDALPPVLTSFNTAIDMQGPLGHVDVLDALPPEVEVLRLARAARPWSSDHD